LPLSTNTIGQQNTSVGYSQKKDVHLPVPKLHQGHNECGPTSLSMVLNYYGLSSVKFDSCTIGSDPLRLVEAAERKGMCVRQENKGTIEDLTALIDLGIPPIVLGINGGKQGDTLWTESNLKKGHWMVVSGYQTDARGVVTNLYVNNPATGTKQTYTKKEFLKFWDDNLIPGGHRYYLAMTPKKEPRYAFQLAALKRCLPQDKISHKFRTYLELVHRGENVFYAVEDAVDTVAGAAEDVWGEVKSWFS